MHGRNKSKVSAGVKRLRKGRHLELNADAHPRVSGQEEVRGVRNGWAPGRGCRQTVRVTRGRR